MAEENKFKELGSPPNGQIYQQSDDSLQTFFSDNKNKILSTIEQNQVKSVILDDKCKQDMEYAGEQIRQGKLVAFPTETVYGLGANAFDETAVKSIFQVKRRPLTDPVIVHIAKKEDGLKLVDITEGVQRVYNFLADTFWPGPLTLILKANFDVIPRVVTAQTDFVGVRCPDNEVARKLIEISQRPIAAPSANLFAHVSPTSAVHVFNDFYDQEISIIKDWKVDGGVSCDFGIESSVIKIQEVEDGQFNLILLRYGSLSEEKLVAAIAESEEFRNKISIMKKKKEHSIKDEHENQEAPGQLLKHYSPNISCYLFSQTDQIRISSNSSSNSSANEQDIIEIDIKDSVILDYMNINENLSKQCLKYISLSQQGDMKEIMIKLYDSLRWAENIPNAKSILIYNIDQHFSSTQTENSREQKIEHLETVYDKIFRSTSGKKVIYNEEKQQFFQLKEQQQQE